MNISQLAEALEPEMRKAISDLIANNASAMAVELNDSPEGKLKVSVGLTMTLVNTKLYTQGTLAYSRKFSDEVQSVRDIEDDTNPKLPGLTKDHTVTIKTGGHETTLTGEQFSKAVNRINRKINQTEE